jgi:hypothetical protein
VLGYLRLENTEAPFFHLFLESNQIDTSESLIKKYLLVPNTHRDIFNHQQLDSLIYDQPIAAPYTANPPASPLRDNTLGNDIPPEGPPVTNDTLLTAPPAHQTMGSQPPTQDLGALAPFNHAYPVLCPKTRNAVEKVRNILTTLIPQLTADVIQKVRKSELAKRANALAET